MKNLLLQFATHRDLYLISVSFASILTTIASLYIKLSQTTIFGISISIWLVALVINIIDIHTGIKANTKEKKDKGEKFTFESGKGWRAFEKIFIFTAIIGFIYLWEREIVRLELTSFLSNIFLWIKLIAFFYVILIEIQSIGENQTTRYGYKPKPFQLLDSVIELVNEGILNKLKSLLNI